MGVTGDDRDDVQPQQTDEQRRLGPVRQPGRENREVDEGENDCQPERDRLDPFGPGIVPVVRVRGRERCADPVGLVAPAGEHSFGFP